MFHCRVCLVEAGQIGTPMLNRVPKLVQQRLDELDDDDVVHDIDRQQLTYCLDAYRFETFMQAGDFAELMIARFICAEEPPFRQLICFDKTKKAIGQAVADVSGETALSKHTFGKEDCFFE